MYRIFRRYYTVQNRELVTIGSNVPSDISLENTGLHTADLASDMTFTGLGDGGGAKIPCLEFEA